MMSEDKILNLDVSAGENFIKDLSEVMKIPPDIFEELAEQINGERGLEIEDPKPVYEIWKKANFQPEVLEKSLSVIRFLFGEIVKNDYDVDTVLDEIKEFCLTKDISDFENHRSGLKLFLTPNLKYIERIKFIPFQRGVVDSLQAISGVAQLRAAFKDRDSAEIVGYIPVLQMRLALIDQNQESKSSFAFQTDIKGLNKLITDLNKYKKQLDSIMESLEDKVKIFVQEDEAGSDESK